MSHPRRRLAVTGLLALPLALAVTGCGAGLQAQTYQARTVGDASNVDLGPLAVRNIAVAPPAGGRDYAKGEDAAGTFQVANRESEPDTLLEVTSTSASEVVLLQGGAPAEIEVPANGTTDGASFILRGLADDLVTGEYVPMTFRFQRSGTVDVLVPVATNGRAGRPARTGEEGSPEGEPALQGPAGGHSEGGSAGE